jgi:hypothetical protein
MKPNSFIAAGKAIADSQFIFFYNVVTPQALKED